MKETCEEPCEEARKEAKQARKMKNREKNKRCDEQCRGGKSFLRSPCWWVALWAVHRCPRSEPVSWMWRSYGCARRSATVSPWVPRRNFKSFHFVFNSFLIHFISFHFISFHWSLLQAFLNERNERTRSPTLRVSIGRSSVEASMLVGQVPLFNVEQSPGK